jgi:hypothetical protein
MMSLSTFVGYLLGSVLLERSSHLPMGFLSEAGLMVMVVLTLYVLVSAATRKTGDAPAEAGEPASPLRVNLLFQRVLQASSAPPASLRSSSLEPLWSLPRPISLFGLIGPPFQTL